MSTQEENKGLGGCISPSDIAGQEPAPQLVTPRDPWELPEEPGAVSPHPDEVL